VVVQEAHTHYLARLNERDRLENDARKVEREYALADCPPHAGRCGGARLQGCACKAPSRELGPEPPGTLDEDQETSNGRSRGV